MPREIDEAFIEEAVEQYRRITALREDFEKAAAGVEVVVRSPDSLVEIVVTGSGEFRDVTIAKEAVGGEHAVRDLAKAVLAACRAASDAGEWARQKLYDEHFRDYRPLRTHGSGSNHDE